MISRFLKKLCFIIASVSDNLGDCGETASNLFNATVAACAKLVSENSAMLPNLQLFRCTCHSSLILFVGGGGGGRVQCVVKTEGKIWIYRSIRVLGVSGMLYEYFCYLFSLKRVRS